MCPLALCPTCSQQIGVEIGEGQTQIVVGKDAVTDAVHTLDDEVERLLTSDQGAQGLGCHQAFSVGWVGCALTAQSPACLGLDQTNGACGVGRWPSSANARRDQQQQRSGCARALFPSLRPGSKPPPVYNPD